jgi:beta-N-acetylhexosaminidase
MDAQRGIARRMVIALPRDGLSPAWERDFAAYPPAGVLVFRRDFRDLDDLRRLTTRLRELARPRRLFLAIDEEGGWVSQLDGHLVAPPNARLLARGAGPGDIARAARVTGERLRALGLDWNFAPVADVNIQPRNPVIGPRSFGTDPETVTRAAGEVLAGLRAARVAGCLKHFPGHGDTVLDSHLALPRCDAEGAGLDAHLAPFRAHRDADAVMTAHVLYPALDPERPATFSPAITDRLLRATLGFTGVAITDALEMRGAAQGRTVFETTQAALAAGCDLLLFGTHDDELRRVRLELARALTDGGLDRARFDAARPRLAAFDQRTPEPAADDLARPLASLTPGDWVPWLTGIIERGLVTRGALPAAARALPWRLSAPEFAIGPAFERTLGELGEPLAGPEGGAVELVVVASRVPVPDDALQRMRAQARAGPTVLVGLQNDAFLDDVPEAVARISAADCTPLTRAVVARRLQALRG